MDILLVYPYAKTSNIEDAVKVPPLGLAYLAAVLKQKGYDVGVLDMNAYSLSVDDFKIAMGNYKPRIVGFTCLTPFHSTVLMLCHIAKQYGSKTIVGGAHATAKFAELLVQPSVDYVVLGEGEVTVAKLVEALLSERDIQVWQMEGVAYKFGSKIHRNLSREYISNLDVLPFPARYLLPLGKYKSPQFNSKNLTSIITSRGCPYSCVFCDYRYLMGKKFRRRTPQNVIQEIQECIQNYYVDHISFRDSTFTFDEQWITEFCDLMASMNIRINWDCNGRVNLVTDKMLRQMKEVGCKLISYGIESGDQNILDIAHKGLTTEQSLQAVAMTQKIGIETVGYYILGLPGDTKQTVKKTIEFAKRVGCDYTQFSLATPFPGTPMYDYAVEKDFIRHGVTWDDFSPINKAIMRTESLDFVELEKSLKEAYRSFYLSPKYLMRRFFSLRPNNIKQNLRGLRTFIGQQNG